MISRKTAKKLASLSAVGAGALVLTAEKAEAGIVYQSFQPSPPTVGFHHSDLSYFSVALGNFGGAGSYGFGFSRTHFGGGTPNSFVAGREIVASFLNNVQFAILNSGTLHIFGPGAVFGTTQPASSHFGVAARFWGKTSTGTPPPATHHATFGNASFSDGYALFTFDPGGTPLYGWVELSLSVSNAYGSSADLGPNLTILAYAYDNSGNQIAAGAASPEPESLSLAALALGSLGLRRWRAARKNKAA